MNKAAEQCRGFVRQHNVPRFAGFRLANSDRASIEVDVGHLQPGQLAVAGSDQEGAAHQRTKRLGTGIHQSRAFDWLEMADQA